jgi:hypothetical protein
MAISLEALITPREVTDIRLLASMYPQMDLEVAFLVEGFVTDTADKRLLSSLNC